MDEKSELNFDDKGSQTNAGLETDENQDAKTIPTPGSGRRSGQGLGRGQGQGLGNRRGSGAGRRSRRRQAGPEGNCICPKCGYIIKHELGQSCNDQMCPECNVRLVRQS